MEGVEVAFIFWNKNGHDINFNTTRITCGENLYTGSDNGEILIWEQTDGVWEATYILSIGFDY
jgi:hypothetical protein